MYVFFRGFQTSISKVSNLSWWIRLHVNKDIATSTSHNRKLFTFGYWIREFDLISGVLQVGKFVSFAQWFWSFQHELLSLLPALVLWKAPSERWKIEAAKNRRRLLLSCAKDWRSFHFLFPRRLFLNFTVCCLELLRIHNLLLPRHQKNRNHQTQRFPQREKVMAGPVVET